MAKKYLYILMEIKARELEGRSLLAFEAASRGFKVIIGNKNQIKQLLRSNILPAGIYFDKSLSRGKENQFREISEKGCTIVSQDEESGILNLSYDNFISVRSTPYAVEKASSIFCWGENDFLAWKNYYPKSQKKMHATGSPRIDFWRPDFYDYFQNRIKEIENKYKNYVLISSNFTQVNSYMSEDEKIEKAKTIGLIKNKNDEEQKRNIIKNRKKIFDHFVDLVNNLSSDFEQLNFVIRPHPSENMSGWKNNLKNRKNLNVVFKGSISPWVRAAKLIIHNSCTAGVEAYVTGVPAISYLPIDSDRNEKIPNMLSITCYSEKQVKSYIKKLIEGKSLSEHRTQDKNNLVLSRLANINGDTAAKRIVDILEFIDAPMTAENNLKHAGLKENVLKKIVLKYKWLTGNETKTMRKFPYLKTKELKNIQNDMALITDKYKKLTIKNFYGDLLIVESP